MSLGIATRPSLPLARRIAPAPSSLLDRVVVSATSPPRRRRHPDAPRPNASSWSQSCRRSIVSPQCRPFVAPRCTPGVVSAPAPAIARSRGCPPARSPAVVAALAAAGRRCARCVVVVPAAPVVRVRQSSDPKPRAFAVARCPRRTPPHSSSVPSVVVVVVATVIAVAVAIVAAVIVVNTLGHGSRCRCGRSRLRPRALSVMFAAIGRRLSSCHRRPPPVAAVVVVDLSWAWDPRRRRVVVVLAAALWSSSSSGLVLAAAGWQCFDGAGPRGQNMRPTPTLPIPRFCSEHQNNVNQTSALAAASALTTSRLCWTAAAVPEPTPRRTGRSRLPVPQLSVPTEIGSSGTMTTSRPSRAPC